MLKKSTVLTHPAPARQDAPFRRQGRSERRPEAALFSPARLKLPRQLDLQVGYVEDLSDARTTHGKRRVSARLGWAGEKSGFFSILLEHRGSGTA
jgi:hypothetical protein